MTRVQSAGQAARALQQQLGLALPKEARSQCPRGRPLPVALQLQQPLLLRQSPLGLTTLHQSCRRARLLQPLPLRQQPPGLTLLHPGKRAPQ